MTLSTCVLAEMYLVIPGRDVVVTLPTCVLAEMYPAIPGRDIPSHSVTGCTWPFLAGMWLASFPTRLVSPLLCVVMCHLCRIYFINMGDHLGR